MQELEKKDKIKLYSLSDEPSELEIEKVFFPLKAGFPSPAMDYVKEQIDLNKLLIKNPSSTFLAEVEGESMNRAFISDPALLLIDKAVKPLHNDIVLAVVDGEFTVKFYLYRSGIITLMPANPNYRPIVIKEGMDFEVWGTVTNIIIDPRRINGVRFNRL